MTHLTKSLLLTTIFAFAAVNVIGFDIDPIPLRKRFADSSNVFLGKLIDTQDLPARDKPDDLKPLAAKVKFSVERRWKGAKREEISLLTDLIAFGCDGSPMRQFEIGQKYLVFSEKDYVYFRETLPASSALVEVKRLDNFWFRTWARIYPF